jgi:hypothetical protein
MTMTATRGLYRHDVVTVPAQARKNGGMSGRTGPDTVSFCPGSTATVTMGMNPGCANPLGGGLPVKIHSCGSSPNPCPGPGYVYKPVAGYLRYARTGKMLGAPVNGKLRGQANEVLAATANQAVAIPFDIASADPALGGSFGQVFQQNAGGPLFLTVMNNPCGIVSKLGPQVVSAGAGQDPARHGLGQPALVVGSECEFRAAPVQDPRAGDRGGCGGGDARAGGVCHGLANRKR